MHDKSARTKLGIISIVTHQIKIRNSTLLCLMYEQLKDIYTKYIYHTFTSNMFDNF